MGRNDSTLYTGMSLGTQRVLERREMQKEAKELKKTALLPSAELIIGLIEKERQMIASKALAHVEADTLDENVKSELRALKLYSTYLTTLKLQVSNILRVKKSEVVDG